MAKKSYTTEQIMDFLRRGEALLSQGRTLGSALHELGVTRNTYYRWRKDYGGMTMLQARRLKALEAENARLTRTVGDLTLDNRVLKEVSDGKLLTTPARRRDAVIFVRQKLGVSERLACRALGQSRGALRKPVKRTAEDARGLAARSPAEPGLKN